MFSYLVVGLPLLGILYNSTIYFFIYLHSHSFNHKFKTNVQLSAYCRLTIFTQPHAWLGMVEEKWMSHYLLPAVITIDVSCSSGVTMPPFHL